MPATVATELLQMAAHDLVREELARTGELFQGYHPRMADVHRENAERLREIAAAIGWPTVARVGAEASETAWLLLQHAIGEPALQRGLLPILWDHAQRGEVPGWQAALLEARRREMDAWARSVGWRD